MNVVSVNVGMAPEVEWCGKRVTTGIFKFAVSGSVSVDTLSLDGATTSSVSGLITYNSSA